MSLTELLLAALWLGIGATLVLDCWSWLLTRLFAVPAPNYCLVGRWFSLMPKGQFCHQSISQAAPQQAECVLGWLLHYLIGISFVLPLLWWQQGQWLRQPEIGQALWLGGSTVLLPFLLMQPAFGLGIAAANTASPWRARLRSLVNHLMFGVGIYLSGWLWPFA